MHDETYKRKQGCTNVLYKYSTKASSNNLKFSKHIFQSIIEISFFFHKIEELFICQNPANLKKIKLL